VVRPGHARPRDELGLGERGHVVVPEDVMARAPELPVYALDAIEVRGLDLDGVPLVDEVAEGDDEGGAGLAGGADEICDLGDRVAVMAGAFGLAVGVVRVGKDAEGDLLSPGRRRGTQNRPRNGACGEGGGARLQELPPRKPVHRTSGRQVAHSHGIALPCRVTVQALLGTSDAR